MECADVIYLLVTVFCLFVIIGWLIIDRRLDSEQDRYIYFGLETIIISVVLIMVYTFIAISSSPDVRELSYFYVVAETPIERIQILDIFKGFGVESINSASEKDKYIIYKNKLLIFSGNISDETIKELTKEELIPRLIYIEK